MDDFSPDFTLVNVDWGVKRGSDWPLEDNCASAVKPVSLEVA